MRWISVVCLFVLAAHLASSHPIDETQPSVQRETLSSLEASIGKPTSEHSDREKRTIGVLRRIFPELSKDSFRRKRDVTGEQPAESERKEVRVPFNDNDLKAAATGDNDEAESSNEEVSDDAEEAESGEVTRNKRLGVLGNLFGGGSSGGSGSGGGSGNFLFDIIRQTADGAARAAGSMYRLVVGTDGPELLAYNNDLTVPTAEMAMSAASAPTAVTPVTTAKPPPPPARAPAAPKKPTLVAGSGATEAQDESANAPPAPASGDQSAPAAPGDDGYQAGIPGPITRLFVIANRGIANLIQDLILRLAQTSERIVNFKARLITAII